MDMSSPWLSDLEVDDEDFMNQYQMNNVYQPLDDFGVDSFSSESYTENPSFINQPAETATSSEELADTKNNKASSIDKNTPNPNPKPKPKPKPKPSITTTNSSLPPSNTFTISFGDVEPKEEIIPFSDSFGYAAADTKKVSTTRTPIQAQDHVLSERKRREKLSHCFVSLSALLPNLKKMDKASVLQDATTYIKELQGRVNELEVLSGVKRKDEQESGISVKRSRLIDEDYSSDETNSGASSGPCEFPPEIEVRMSESSVFVRIHCQKNPSSLVKALSEMQKLGFSIISSSAMPFANTTLLITVVAQMEDDFFMTSTDLVKKLQLAI